MSRFLTNWIANNKLIVVLGFFLLIETFLFRTIGYKILEAMYQEKSLPFLNNLLEGRVENSLEFYTKRFSLFFVGFNFILLSVVLFLSYCWRLFAEGTPIFYLSKQGFLDFRKIVLANKRIILLSFLLSLVFYGLYVSISLGLIPFSGNFFDADQGEWLLLEWQKHQKGSYPHRLLILELFGFLRLFSPPIDSVYLAILLNSLFGSLGIFISSLTFWAITKKYFSMIGLTLLFGLSMNQLFFSTLPESRSLQALTIISTYLLFIICLRTTQVYWGYWILTGLFSFGVLITNFMATFFCFSTIIFIQKSRSKIRKILEYTGTIVSLSFLLNILQQVFFAGQSFWVPNTITTELDYTRVNLLNNPLLVLKELLNNFLLTNFVSPSPLSGNLNHLDSLKLSFFDRTLDYSILGLIGLMMWLTLFLVGLYKNLVDSEDLSKALVIAISLFILFNLVLHSFYGVKEMFIYTVNYSFPILLLAVNKSLVKAYLWKIILVATVFLMGINNLNIMREIILTLRT